MRELESSALVVELARDVIQELAPQEVPLFRAQSKAYLNDPGRALQITGSRNQDLGFGAGDEVQILTPFVLALVSQVIAMLAKDVGKTAGKQAAVVGYDRIRMLFKQMRPADSPAADVPPPLTREQVKEIRDVALHTARDLKLSSRQADLLVDALVGRLLVGPA